MEPTQAISPPQVAASRCDEEAVDARSPSCTDPTGEKVDEEPEPPATEGVAPGEVDPRHRASEPVLTTVEQVRAALEQASIVGHHDVVVWGRCARCGRVGRVVHFDGTFRARAQAP
jgi:hypothetical protein